MVGGTSRLGWHKMVLGAMGCGRVGQGGAGWVQWGRVGWGEAGWDRVGTGVFSGAGWVGWGGAGRGRVGSVGVGGQGGAGWGRVGQGWKKHKTQWSKDLPLSEQDAHHHSPVPVYPGQSVVWPGGYGRVWCINWWVEWGTEGQGLSSISQCPDSGVDEK